MHPYITISEQRKDNVPLPFFSSNNVHTVPPNIQLGGKNLLRWLPLAAESFEIIRLMIEEKLENVKYHTHGRQARKKELYKMEIKPDQEK